MSRANNIPGSVRITEEWLNRIVRIACCICNKQYVYEDLQAQIRDGAEWHYVTITSKLICAECVRELGIKTTNAPAGAES